MSYEKLFEYNLDFAGVTDYRVNMTAVLTEQIGVPLQGAQFDVALSSSVTGRILGSLRGIDYLRVRADGRCELEFRDTVETDDGSRIAFSAKSAGTYRKEEPIVDLAVRVDLLTAAEPYSWVNAKPGWGSG